ncbi:MAG: hypothetical protein GY774_37055 [Planctomycetes bacterium]|nr:hypothetical protein [Planctomycetota bacterium]
MKQRQKDAIKYYCSGETKGNWSASLRLAGYSDNYSKVGGYKLLEKDSMQKALAEEKNRTDVKDEISIQIVRDNFLEDRRLAKDKDSIGNMVRVDENLAKHCGFYGIDNKQKQPQSIIDIMAICGISVQPDKLTE